MKLYVRRVLVADEFQDICNTRFGVFAADLFLVWENYTRYNPKLRELSGKLLQRHLPVEYILLPTHITSHITHHTHSTHVQEETEEDGTVDAPRSS